MGEVVRIDEWRDRPARGPSDADLARAARAGSLSAREELFRRHYPRILRLAYRLMGREDDAEDLTQDVFVEALKSLHRLEDEAAFPGWLGSICVHRARSRIRTQTVMRRLGLSDRLVDPDSVVSRTAPADVAYELRALYATLLRLRADVRIALVLRRVEGLSIPEIARQMGRSEATVKRRLAEGEARLARLTGGPERE